MDHVAIDLGGRESQICVRSADGSILEERRVATTGLRKYLEKRPSSVVVVEIVSLKGGGRGGAEPNSARRAADALGPKPNKRTCLPKHSD